MPQDSLRLAVYRSFVKCHDRKGFVDCKTIRRSRKSSQEMDHKIDSQRTPKNSNTSMAYKAEKGEVLSKGSKEEVHGPSSFQLMEVSRGAQKLNQMIDMWSKGVKFNGQSKVIAKDWLKNSLDLQESLIMLGKLQEASDHTVQLKKKQKEKSESRRIDEVGNGRTYSRQYEDHNTSIAYKAEKGEMLSKGLTEEVHNPSSFQLVEVSRGAQKLTQMIDSWSKGVTFDGQSEDIAKDLLNGALDLQKSLIALGKLQEASDYMAKLKKQNEKSERRRIDEVGIERTYSSELEYHNFSMELQKPRLSVDGSSRNHIEELKKVIVDSLARQNLLPNPTSKETDFLHKRCFDSASETPSTSSNKSLMVHASDIDSTGSFLSSTDPQGKTKAPNLIAKLMGLQELPSKSMQATLQKHSESERIPNQQRPMFDIDMPKGRKPLYTAQNVDPERRNLKKILETMQYKGLLKSISARDLNPHSYHSNYFNSKQRLIDEIPPIVLIKPTRVPCQLENYDTAVLQEDESLNTKEILPKLKVKEVLPSKTHKEGALSSKKIHSKMDAAEMPFKMHSLQGAKDHKVVRKTEEKEVKPKEKASNKLKASGPAAHERQKKESIDKATGKIQKVAAASRGLLGMENVKAKIVPRSEVHAKVTSIKLKKPENGSNLINNQAPRQPSTTKKTISRHATKTLISNSSDQKKNQKKKTKPVREPIEAKSIIENSGSKEDGKMINLNSEHCSPLMRTNTALVDKLPMEEEKEVTESHFEEHCSISQSPLSEVTPSSPEQERDDKTTAVEVYNHVFHSRTDIKSSKTGSNLRTLLLSSPSFLSRVEELFDLNESSSAILQTPDIDDSIVANHRLSLECANELIERKGLRVTQAVHHSLLMRVGQFRACISIDKLVEEVCNGVENLRSYSKLTGGSLPVDSLFAMLGRDINCNGVENGIWELGWMHEVSLDYAEQVVNEIETLVFNGLIEEVLT
ncbi:hypothetical protein F2P56_002619 [Juglans regia]|nr:uncharacterized protein LOC108979359 isoform X2 [Juglans regia]XP_035541480.1 uncharacterized protein LOC108979359 isoform X2 [Juglans regia]XP_035541489.1 uncharacterized protein LOC108979359 isoform X2 [Juglans regia]XP_035541514.1 uncharacterized protein LOC108979359 isoform X2 [Juglans regia]KAF5482018.1 hypothetical protein F2P56_002619 [Juglans regia]